MRSTFKLLVPFVLGAVALATYLVWTQDRRSGPLLSDLRTLPIESEGTPGDAGNLLAIEVKLLPADYQSRERLQLRFATYLEQARAAGLLNERTVVVLPEHVGTGLFALGERAEVQQARSLRDAMQWTALSNPWKFLRALLDNQSKARRTEAVLRIKAERMAEDYQAIFGGLARDYAVTLVAGSIVLPEPYLQRQRLHAGTGPLRQVSLTFDHRGQPIGPLQYKHALSRYERRYSEAPENRRAATLATAAGELAVALGCDGYRQAPPEDADFIVMPGAPADPESSCPNALEPAGTTPRLEVHTLGMPWNLVGSPRQLARHRHGPPVQLHNLWLPARP
ncbi:carbon-nitrogen hydrolase [Stutzerimonas nitrititolerans]|uniref:carbon-nitrogen hydrolase n=1 Tax=Stutzerimonas nitrititolerans TaxID=2482751 RepID=UPI000F781663|nr:carbon-nitrogen hydrolase [Stutzerimonas nitrititolerans]RRV23780.1 carbon-nitrogen hydrolase [Pseudomonas sp. s199]